MPAQVTLTHPLSGDTAFPLWNTQINNDLEAIASNFYSDDNSAPAVQFPFQWRADMGSTNGPYLYLGNEAANAWFCVAKLDDADAVPPVFALGVYVSKDTEGTVGANKIAFTLQVKDPRATLSAASITGRRRVLVVVATSTFGAPGGTQTLAVTTGVLLKAHTADQLLEIETDVSGTAVVTVEVTGAGDRYVRASVGDGEATELQGTWA